MSRRLDIGVASYGDHQSLRRTLSSIASNSQTDWRCFVIDNPGPDPRTRPTIEQYAGDDPRFVPVMMPENRGYSGAVNKLFELAETEYVAYCDNDIMIRTPGWDEKLCAVLDAHHEVGMVGPNGWDGIAAIPRPNYVQVMWMVGFCWVVSRVALDAVGGFDESLGHQDECDFCLRMRMAGWRCATIRGVAVKHAASASTNPESQARITAGVIRFVDKWVRYFCGKGYDYHSPEVLRWEDWPPNALHLEEWYKTRPELAGINDEPETVALKFPDSGVERVYDLLRVPRYKDFYRGRII